MRALYSTLKDRLKFNRSTKTPNFNHFESPLILIEALQNTLFSDSFCFNSHSAKIIRANKGELSSLRQKRSIRQADHHYDIRPLPSCSDQYFWYRDAIAHHEVYRLYFKNSLNEPTIIRPQIEGLKDVVLELVERHSDQHTHSIDELSFRWATSCVGEIFFGVSKRGKSAASLLNHYILKHPHLSEKALSRHPRDIISHRQSDLKFRQLIKNLSPLWIERRQTKRSLHSLLHRLFSPLALNTKTRNELACRLSIDAIFEFSYALKSLFKQLSKPELPLDELFIELDRLCGDQGDITFESLIHAHKLNRLIGYPTIETIDASLSLLNRDVIINDQRILAGDYLMLIRDSEEQKRIEKPLAISELTRYSLLAIAGFLVSRYRLSLAGDRLCFEAHEL